MNENSIRLIILSGFLLLFGIFSCARLERNRDTSPSEIQFDLPPKHEPPALQIINYKNRSEGADLALWLRSYLENGIAGPESLAAYYGSYLFIAVNRNVNQTAIDLWKNNYSPERDFSRLVAERIQSRLEQNLPGRPPDMVYGPHYERALKAAYGNTFWGSQRLDDTWALGISIARDEAEQVEPDLPMYWGFILVSIPRETLEIQITELLSKVIDSSGSRSASREQNNAFNQVRENFFERF